MLKEELLRSMRMLQVLLELLQQAQRTVELSLYLMLVREQLPLRALAKLEMRKTLTEKLLDLLGLLVGTGAVKPRSQKSMRRVAVLQTNYLLGS